MRFEWKSRSRVSHKVEIESYNQNIMDKAHFGMVGLGTMGRNFLLNVAEKGTAAVGYDLDAGKRTLLLDEGNGFPVTVADSLTNFVDQLKTPRNIMLLVPAGPIVDTVIENLIPHLSPGDLIIDGGNSHFTDTERRETYLADKGIGFMGVGVSGGEEGARHGPSIMPGGKQEFYSQIEKIFQSVAAKVNGEPCVTFIGSGSAGHFVKMVHNGIEYGVMQLIAEVYDYMKRVRSMSAIDISKTFRAWDNGELNSFLVEISSIVMAKNDDETNSPLVDVILDTAGQKGTGKWTSQAAMDFGVPVPTIDSAVTMRQISAQKELRKVVGGTSLGSPIRSGAAPLTIDELEQGLLAAILLTYTQGMSLLQTASTEKQFGLDLSEVAKIWRGGCIIRSRWLEEIRLAFTAKPDLPTLLLDSNVSERIKQCDSSLRKMVESSASFGIPAMCFSATLAYYDAFCSERLPANLIQAQRDFFGAHTYQRIDKTGTFHTADWES